jgi:hypothetical protein
MTTQNENLNNFGGINLPNAPGDFLRDSIILLLRAHFKDHPTHYWKKNSQETKIDIVDEWSFNRETAGRRPALVIFRGGTRHIKLGIGNLKSYRWAKKNVKNVSLVESAFRISCISKLPLESERLGGQVFSVIKYREEDFRELSGMIDLNLILLNPRSVQLMTSRPELVDTPVDFTVSYVDEWLHSSDIVPLLSGIIESQEIMVDP